MDKTIPRGLMVELILEFNIQLATPRYPPCVYQASEDIERDVEACNKLQQAKHMRWRWGRSENVLPYVLYDALGGAWSRRQSSTTSTQL